MKNPLNYQVTEYDCGPTTLMNAMSVLFKREEIPPDVIKHIMMYCMDSYNNKGEFAKSGTSTMAMYFLSNWLTEFGHVKGFPIQSEYLSGEDVHISQNCKITDALRQNGVAIVRLMYGCWHYVLLTEVSDQAVGLFDPYYRKRSFQEDGITMVKNDPYRKNRMVDFPFFNRTEKTPYALGPLEQREAVLLFNESTRKPMQEIEYYI